MCRDAYSGPSLLTCRAVEMAKYPSPPRIHNGNRQRIVTQKEAVLATQDLSTSVNFLELFGKGTTRAAISVADSGITHKESLKFRIVV